MIETAQAQNPRRPSRTAFLAQALDSLETRTREINGRRARLKTIKGKVNRRCEDIRVELEECQLAGSREALLRMAKRTK
jgi:hypothetical protein